MAGSLSAAGTCCRGAVGSSGRPGHCVAVWKLWEVVAAPTILDVRNRLGNPCSERSDCFEQGIHVRQRCPKAATRSDRTGDVATVTGTQLPSRGAHLCLFDLEEAEQVRVRAEASVSNPDTPFRAKTRGYERVMKPANGESDGGEGLELGTRAENLDAVDLSKAFF